MKKLLKTLTIGTSLIMLMATACISQERLSIAVIGIDTKDLDVDNETVSNIVRLELEKIDQFEVLDKYDVTDILKANDIDPNNCFGKNQVVKAGKLLSADKMITGNAERYGEKIIITLRMIDIQSAKIEKTSVMEYLDIQKELQTMALISLNELLSIPNDPYLVDLLINYNLPITSSKTTVSLTGPRIGMAYTTGQTGNRLQDSKSQGGYNMFPVTSMFGYQYEMQYLSSGDFQALIEVIGAVTGLESGNFIPSVTFLNGFRFNQSGFEFGAGPTFRLVKKADGFYNENDEWVLASKMPEGANYEIEEVVDRRGSIKPNIGLIVAVGKTFHSGYLNMPVNLYFSPSKSGNVIGLTFGFNTSKKPNL